MKMTIIDLGKKIEAENAKFEKMSKNKKRVVVAKDCLDRIGLQQIEPYFERFCIINREFEHEDISVKETLNTNTGNICKACAKGSLFMSYVGRVNKVNFTEINGFNDEDDDEHIKLLEIFTLRQLAFIEYAFEGCQFIYRDEEGKAFQFNENKINEFRDKFEDSNLKLDAATNILVAICENIIENKGTFKL